MAEDSGGIDDLVRSTARKAGRHVGATRRAFRVGRQAGDLPTAEDGEVHIVCRLAAQRRTVALNDDGRPDCYEQDQAACEGCHEDILAGVIETWEPAE